MIKIVRRSAIVLYFIIIAVMAAATVAGKTGGSSWAADNIYGTWWFVALWALLATTAVIYIISNKLQKRPFVLLLHAALLFILIGALVTHTTGLQGSMHMRTGEQLSVFVDNDGMARPLPFSVRLDGFTVENYPGTQSPMDYVSNITFCSNSKTSTACVAMNHIAEFRNYRFYQAGYDPDQNGTYLSISHDPAGIGITYTGYALLFVAMLLLLIAPNEGFRRALKKVANSKITILTILLTTSCLSTSAKSNAPKTLPADVAKEFGNIMVYSNGRICPMQTVARNFTIKIYGKPTYKGMSAEQVLAGWTFFPSSWADEPMVKLKGAARNLVSDGNKYASYSEFHHLSRYKLEDAMSGIMQGKQIDGAKAIREADEKMHILQMTINRQLLKIFPYTDNNTQIRWFCPTDKLPLDMPDEQSVFIKKTMDYIAELAFTGDVDGLMYTIGKIEEYQHKIAGKWMPPESRTKAEKLYNTLSYTRIIAMLFATIGIIAFLFYTMRWVRHKPVLRVVSIILNALLAMATVYLTTNIILRGIIGGHIPLSNGFETMQFMALCTLLLTLALQHRFKLIIPFGFLISGLALMVSMFSESSPQITHLMPVLSSPLLSMHVCVLMLAYTLLAFMMLNGITAIIINIHTHDSERIGQLYNISRMMLYPALFLLALGIFIGAIWANQSWGRYWGWDPKEVWALITMMLYAVPLHGSLFPSLQKPINAHIYLAAAFLSVLMTYFGVNFLLGGMHSYA